jgi:hypothetical protein
MRESVLNQFDQQPAEESADVKLLRIKINLEKKKEEILRKISETEDIGRREILMLDMEDIERQINQCPDSIGTYNRKRKISRIEKIAGEQNVAEVLDFKGKQRAKNKRQADESETKIEIPEDIKNSISPGFLAGLEKFKKDRGGRPQLRA